MHFVTAPYTPQGGTEKSAVPGVTLAMLFFCKCLEQGMNGTFNCTDTCSIFLNPVDIASCRQPAEYVRIAMKNYLGCGMVTQNFINNGLVEGMKQLRIKDEQVHPAGTAQIFIGPVCRLEAVNRITFFFQLALQKVTDMVITVC